MNKNLHDGKLGVLCLAPREGMGVVDTALREKLLPKIQLYRS